MLSVQLKMSDSNLSRVALRRIARVSQHVAVPHFETSNLDVLTPSFCKALQVTSGNKIATADEAVSLIQDGDVVTVGGFVSAGCPDWLLQALATRFRSTGHPCNLTLLYVASAADGGKLAENAAHNAEKGKGLERLAVEGLVSKIIYSWTGSAPGFLQLITQNKVQAWNLPLGVVSHMIRDVAAGRPGPVTHVGLGTFVDPRIKGGKSNSCSVSDMVEVVQLGGRELLWYKAPPAIHCAILRGTTADTAGNISCEREPLLLDTLNQALAAHNSGGRVIVQVERLVAAGTIPPRSVHIHAALVDKVVVSPASHHWQTLSTPHYNPALSGEVRLELSSLHQPMPCSERSIIAHRALLEIPHPGSIVNLGVGMPEGVGQMLSIHGASYPATTDTYLTTEAGVLGGIPQSGLMFGTALNADCYIPTASMLDLYNGGGVDVAFLGMAQVDEIGNVNVSNFGNGKMPGCGGFIDISQSAKKVVFMGTFTSTGLQIGVGEGKLSIKQEGKRKKFIKSVFEKTFVSSSARGRPCFYVTERAVFRLVEGQGVELIEVAPGVDVQRQVLDLMDFQPIMKDVKIMDRRIFLSM